MAIFRYQDGGRPLSWICKVQNFNFNFKCIILRQSCTDPSDHCRDNFRFFLQNDVAPVKMFSLYTDDSWVDGIVSQLRCFTFKCRKLLKQNVALRRRNRTVPPCSIGLRTGHARYRRRQTTTGDRRRRQTPACITILAH